MRAEGRTYAEGANFGFTLDVTGFLVCRVWKRPDLDAETGAALAHEMASAWQRAGGDPEVVGGVFDLREAPPVFGPRTEGAFRTTLARMGGKRIALLSGDNAVQRLQLQRIVAGHRHAVVVDSPEAARLHAMAGPTSGALANPPSSRR
jgi:hypothetical protein